MNRSDQNEANLVPAWCRALTLPERVRDCASHQSTDIAPPSPEADLRFQLWREQPPFDLPAQFARRLRADGLDERELLAMLCESDETLASRLRQPPQWMRDLSDAFESRRSPADDSAHNCRSFLNLVRPLLVREFRRLDWRIDQLAATHGALPFQREALVNQLLQHLGDRLLRVLSPSLVLELNVARIEERLVGDTPAVRFEFFLRQLLDQDRARTILDEYPLMARIAAETVRDWGDATIEFLARLCGDWAQLQDMFGRDRPLGDVVQIDGLAGDVHRRGRSVAILTFQCGRRLVYKPRSLAAEVHFQNLLRWLNERGATPAFRMLDVLDRESHGWVEYVAHADCTSLDELRRFYERQGALVALFYALEGTDFHSENIVAAGEHPVPIDLETLFQPLGPARQDDPLATTFQEAVGRSVLMSGLLPCLSWRDGQGAGVDISGIGGRGGHVAPDAARHWAGAETDEMSVRQETAHMSPDRNVPRLDGQLAQPAEFLWEIERGFQAMYRLLVDRRDELLGAQGPLSPFAQDEVRVILRDSRTYALLLRDSYHPDLMRDALDRDRHWDRLWTRTVREPSFARVVPFERLDLQHGDVPMFTTRPDSRDLWTSDRQRLPGYFERSGMDAVRQRIQALGEDDLARQSWLLRGSLGTLAHPTRVGRAAHEAAAAVGATRALGVSRANRPVRSPSLNASPEAGCDLRAERISSIASSERALAPRLLAAAEGIADHLRAGSVLAHERRLWMGVKPTGANWSVGPLGMDLYEGLAGIALFYAQLGAVQRDARWTRIAEESVATLVEAVDSDQHGLAGIGAFGGWGGVVYALTHLGSLWNRDDLLARAERIVSRMAPQVDADREFDIIGGSAGFLATILGLHATRPSSATFAAAVRCGERLVRGACRSDGIATWNSGSVAPRPLTGFSHGAAGIAWALDQLFDASGDRRFRDVAHEGLAFERSTFRADVQNWPDYREDPYADSPQDGSNATAGTRCVVTWCHGAPGIGLARLKMYEREANASSRETLRREMAAAIHTTLQQGFGLNHSLCHGDLGNLELIDEASRALSDFELGSRAAAIATHTVDLGTSHGWRCGAPVAAPTAGLMTGLAGIGWQLMRLARPAHVPSVLTLDPPVTANDRTA